MNPARRVLFLVAALVPAAALACSGPGADDAIVRAILVGWACGVVSFGATVVLFLKTRRGAGARWGRVARWLGVALLLIHPGWWMSALSGDCGQTRLMASPIVMLLHLGMVMVLWKAKRPAT